MDFTEFDLHPDLLDGIEALNFKTATPIQQQAIPLILEGKDLIGVAQTGTGKTAAFILPILNQIIESGEANFVQALVVVPTRELAMQIDNVIQAYSYFSGVSSMAVYGGGDGKSFAQEKTALTGGADIIIATPGRLIAHMNMGYVKFSKLRFLVLDEADRMLDMGFKPDLLKIIDTLNPKRQGLLFSATMPPEILKFAKSLLRDPITISIAVSKPAAGVTQQVYIISDRQKLALVTSLLNDAIGQRVIVFGSTKQSVSALYQRLAARKMSVGQISSDVEQEQREQIMIDYRNRKIDILVATDVLSRGIDVDGIEVVINYDVPRDPEDYVHRIGRTARAERTGVAITLVSPLDQTRYQRIEKFLGKILDKMPLPPGFGDSEPETGRREERRGDPKNNKKRRSGQGVQKKHPEKRATDAPPATPAVAVEGGENAVATEAKSSAAKKRRRNRRRGKDRKQTEGAPQQQPPASSDAPQG